MATATEMLSYETRKTIPVEYRRAGLVLLVWGGIAAPSGFLLFVLVLTLPAMSGDLWGWLGGLLAAVPFLAVLFLWAGFGVNALRGGYKLLKGHDVDLGGTLGMNGVALAISLMLNLSLFLGLLGAFWGVWGPGWEWVLLLFLLITMLTVTLSLSLWVLRKCQQRQQFDAFELDGA